MRFRTRPETPHRRHRLTPCRRPSPRTDRPARNDGTSRRLVGRDAVRVTAGRRAEDDGRARLGAIGLPPPRYTYSAYTPLPPGPGDQRGSARVDRRLSARLRGHTRTERERAQIQTYTNTRNQLTHTLAGPRSASRADRPRRCTRSRPYLSVCVCVCVQSDLRFCPNRLVRQRAPGHTAVAACPPRQRTPGRV